VVGGYRGYVVGGCRGYVVCGCRGYVAGGCRGYVVGGCRGYVVFRSGNIAKLSRAGAWLSLAKEEQVGAELCQAQFKLG
jgi:hypothetical protein